MDRREKELLQTIFNYYWPSLIGFAKQEFPEEFKKITECESCHLRVAHEMQIIANLLSELKKHRIKDK